MGKGGGGHFSGTRGSSSSKSINKIINGAKETTRPLGKAINLEKSGGYKKALEDFSSLNPNSTKSISTKYGDGKFGVLEDELLTLAIITKDFGISQAVSQDT